MTYLNRIVKRATFGHTVILHPGAQPLVEIREAGRRKGFSIPVANLYVILAQRAAEQARAEKRAIRLAAKRNAKVVRELRRTT